MTEEVKNTEEGNGSEKPQLTPIEQRAVEQGWVPKDAWEGEPDEWRPAKEFIDRGELFKKIDEQNRTVKELKRDLALFARHHENVKATEYKRALEDLKAQKKTALVEGDPDAVIEIDEKIALVREAAQKEQPSKQVQQAQPDPQANIIFQAWVTKNQWYNANPAMRAYADRVGNDVGSQGNVSPSDVLRQVEQEVKKQFPERFNNPNREKAGSVEGSTNKGGKSKDTFSLTDDERRAMNRFVKTIPGYTEEKYIAELKKIKGA